LETNMTKEGENIELRSEKVRNIIGQIPPRIMRIGITVIFLVFTSVLIGTYFFEYDYTIKTSAILTRQGESIMVQIKIPVNQSNRIKKNQKVILIFDNVPNMQGQRIITTLTSALSTIEVSEKGGFYISECYLPDNTKTETGDNIEIKGILIVNAEIQTGKIRFFDRLFEPLRIIFQQR